MQPQDVVKDLIKDFQDLSGRYSLITLFDDFCCMAMACLHNSPYTIGKLEPQAHYKDTVAKLEENYEKIAKKYDTQAWDKFAFILAKLITAMHKKNYDYLGSIYMMLGLGNANAGQFFTPSHICDLMANLTINKASIEQCIKDRKPITMHDPTCGSGAMAIGFINALKNDCKLEDYEKWVHITLIDIDYLCVKMAYIQMAILGVAATVICGNTLTMEICDKFDTPNLQTQHQATSQVNAICLQSNTQQLNLF